MNINKETGCIALTEIGASISASLSRSQFLQTPAFSGAIISVKNEPWCSYQLPEVPQVGSRLHIVFQFHGEDLFQLRLSHGADRFGTSWADSSEERELARKAFHEEWLTRELGVHLGGYLWGDISSNYDPRSGVSSVTICYECNNV